MNLRKDYTKGSACVISLAAPYANSENLFFKMSCFNVELFLFEANGHAFVSSAKRLVGE